MAADDDMEALMGFASFGAQRARRRQRQDKRVHHRDGLSHSASASSQHARLAQVIPGTEVPEQLHGRGRLEQGPQGVTLLANETKSSTQSDGNASNGDGLKPLDELLSAWSSASGADKDANALEARLLPPSCYQRLDELQEQKNRFDELDNTVFRRARSAANPYESLGRSRFLNRSAMKLANMDHIFQWTARPADYPDASASPVFTFADVCGGPGGFSEYLLWKHSKLTGGVRVRGYGISLKDEICDWKLPPLDNPNASFEISYGEDGTGNLYSVDNIRHFRKLVRENHAEGVDLVVSDGGFQDARDQPNQEEMMTKLILAEILTMLSILKVHGSFLCKTFEITTPMLLQLVWLLHQCFEKIAIIKPITSRPASSERYLVAVNLRDHLPMHKIVSALEARLESPDKHMKLLFDPNILSGDATFLQYMAAVSDRMAASQIWACKAIHDRANSKRKRHSHDDNWVDPTRYSKCWGLDDANFTSKG